MIPLILLFIVIILVLAAFILVKAHEINDSVNEIFDTSENHDPEERIREELYIDVLMSLLSNPSVTEKSSHEDIVKQAKELSEIAYNYYTNV